MNSIHQNINFTTQIEKKYLINNFLDLAISRVNNKHAFFRYFKFSLTDAIIHKTSAQPF